MQAFENKAHDIEWAGHYEQGGSKNNVSFKDMKLGTDGTITGSGSDPVGSFTINGKLNGNNIEFNKAYAGAHTVKYSGTLNNGVIGGNWSLQGMTGKFEIKMKTKQWKGHYTLNGQKFDMLVSLNISDGQGQDHFVSGIGGDANGNYGVQGIVPRAAKHNTIVFNKVYYNNPSAEVHYAGIILGQGTSQTIKGVWTLPSGNMHGEFELAKQI